MKQKTEFQDYLNICLDYLMSTLTPSENLIMIFLCRYVYLHQIENRFESLDLIVLITQKTGLSSREGANSIATLVGSQYLIENKRHESVMFYEINTHLLKYISKCVSGEIEDISPFSPYAEFSKMRLQENISSSLASNSNPILG